MFVCDYVIEVYTYIVCVIEILVYVYVYIYYYVYIYGVYIYICIYIYGVYMYIYICVHRRTQSITYKHVHTHMPTREWVGGDAYTQTYIQT